MKIIVTKDEHLMQGFRNKFRKPSWEEDVIKKHQFIINFMKENNIKHKVTTGDIFDKQKGWSFKQFLANKKILEMYKEAGIEIISIAGNHDMIDGRKDIKDSPFEEMVNDGLIKYIGDYGNAYDFIDLDEDGSIQARIRGIDYRYINDEYTKKDFFYEIETLFYNTEKTKILVIHQNVTPRQESVTEFTYNEITKVCNEKGIKILICGHYHVGYEPQIVNDVLVINPWNLWRVVRDYNVKEELHTPEFYVVNLKDLSCERVEIPHKTYAQAFDLKEVEFYKKLKKENKHFFEFAESFKNLSNIEDENDLQILYKFINEIKEKYNLKEKDIIKISEELSSYFES